MDSPVPEETTGYTASGTGPPGDLGDKTKNKIIIFIRGCPRNFSKEFSQKKIKCLLDGQLFPHYAYYVIFPLCLLDGIHFQLCTFILYIHVQFKLKKTTV